MEEFIPFNERVLFLYFPLRKPQPSPADAPSRHFEVKVVGVERVVVRPEHGRKEAASALMHVGEETAFRRLLAPVFEHADAAPVGEVEARNVDRIAPRMAAAAAVFFMVHVP